MYFSMSGTPRFISPVTDSCHLQDKLWATAISLLVYPRQLDYLLFH